MLNISASPFWLRKRELRRDMLATIARTDNVPVVMVNQVGGNDSLLFDGSSLVLNREGKVIAQGKSFEEDIVYFDSATLAGEMHEQIEGDEASAYAALVLGTRDYVRKCGFGKVIIGLSGGIDSALTAAIATDALGPENVIGVGMPGPYSSPGSIEDARALAKNLGIRFELLCITDICKSYQVDSERCVRRAEGRRHRRKHSIARSRVVADGAVEQAERHRALDRKQERDRSRLLHAVWRHGRRPGGHFRCAQDHGVSDQPIREFAEGT